MKKTLSSLFIVLTSLSFASIQEEKPYEIISDQCELKILNPDLAERQTAKLKLKNGLQAYIISDPGTDQSAAAIAVEAGSWSDPEEYPGTAHFLEHMLFLGNAAYPDEEGFFKYVIDNSGTPNAYTHTDRTVYMFSVNNEAFDQGLDQFSHFFIDPLFKPSGIGRELHAVDQENDKNIENDNWREWMIFKETGNPKHPNSKFSTGNAKTLGNIPQHALKKWFEENYSADKMHLIVYSALPLETLISIVSEDFSKIPTIQAKQFTKPGNLTSSTQLGHLTTISPIKDIRQLSLIWELPPTYLIDQDTKTPELVASALGSGHAEGFYETLKKEGLVEGLHTSIDQYSKENALFILNLDLTKKGTSEVDQVIKYCFQAIKLLKEKGIPPYLFNEMQKMAEINYQYQSRENAFEFVMHSAHTLVDEPLETYPQKTVMPTYFNPKKVDALLAELTPENCAFFLMAPPHLSGTKPKEREKWLGGEYSVTKISEENISYWDGVKKHPKITLPEPNRYIPSELKILTTKNKASEALDPKLIGNDEFGKAYYAEDPKYQVPESVMILNFLTPLIDGSPRQTALLDLYLATFHDMMAPLFYQAGAGNLYPHFSSHQIKLILAVNGYSEKAPELLREILSSFKTFIPSEDKFHIYKESLLSQYESQEKSMPLSQANEILSHLIYNNAPKSNELAEAMQEITYEDLVRFSDKLLTQSYVEGMFVGNISESESKSIWQNVRNTLTPQNYPLLEHLHPTVLMLPDREGPFLIKEKTSMQGNAVLLMLQEGVFTFESRASQLVLEKLLSQAFFATLRTKQQTAYIAKSWAKEDQNQLLHFFAVQSSTHQPEDLISRFELFLEGYAKDFEENLPQERFDHVRNMLISKLLMPLPNLEEYALRLHKFAFTDDGDFNRVDKLIVALRDLKYEKFKEDVLLFVSRKNGKRLAVLLQGATHPEKDFRYHPISPDSLKEIGHHVSKQEPGVL